jgi:hypothetical protein
MAAGVPVAPVGGAAAAVTEMRHAVHAETLPREPGAPASAAAASHSAANKPLPRGGAVLDKKFGRPCRSHDASFFSESFILHPELCNVSLA